MFVSLGFATISILGWLIGISLGSGFGSVGFVYGLFFDEINAIIMRYFKEE